MRLHIAALALLLASCAAHTAAIPKGARSREPLVTNNYTPIVVRAVEESGLTGTLRVAVRVEAPAQFIPSVVPPDRLTRIWIDTLRLVGPDDQVNPYVKSLELWIDDEGRILQAISAPVDESPFPSVKSYEEQLPSVNQRYLGIPAAHARIPLEEAIRRSRGVESARQIIVYYTVMTSVVWRERPQRDVWVVHAWGMPAWAPVGGPPHSVPERYRNHLRSVIDAQTGQRYRSDTIPQPE